MGVSFLIGCFDILGRGGRGGRKGRGGEGERWGRGEEKLDRPAMFRDDRAPASCRSVRYRLTSILPDGSVLWEET